MRRTEGTIPNDCTRKRKSPGSAMMRDMVGCDHRKGIIAIPLARRSTGFSPIAPRLRDSAVES